MVSQRSLCSCFACGLLLIIGSVWRRLDVLFTEGQGLEDSDLFDYIGESKNMTASLAEYGSQKSTAVRLNRTFWTPFFSSFS